MITSSGHDAKYPRPLWRVLLGALATVLVVGEMATGGVWDLLRIPYAREVITRLGYPTYLLVFLGVVKVPAAVVLMVPGLGRLKDWAYSAAFVTYVVASASHVAVGDEVSAVLVPGTLAALTLASWWLRSPASCPAAHSTGKSARSFVYWVTTLLLTAVCVLGAVLDVLHAQPLIGIALRLGYPAYFLTILGVSYGAAVVALLVPRVPRLKEWAYAGLVLSHVGAAASHVAVGDRVSSLLVPALLLALTLASYVLRPPGRRNVRLAWDAPHGVAFSN